MRTDCIGSGGREGESQSPTGKEPGLQSWALLPAWLSPVVNHGLVLLL